MPRIRYRTYRPQAEAREIIENAVAILQEYADQGFDLTLRQLYYQFVARDLFPASYENAAGTKNNVQSYNRLGAIVSAAREGGLIDWDYITDRGRSSEARPHWCDAEDFVASVAPQFNVDLWEHQPRRVEVWVEKDALSAVVERACRPLDVPYTACKGYMSASTMWQAAQRMRANWRERRQPTIVLHLGDHDPSGIDMTRDIDDRLHMFAVRPGDNDPCDITVVRIALTRDQVEQYQPPPNPAKETDSRFATYQAVFGQESWELDALEPQTIVDLITTRIEEYTAALQFRRAQRREADQRAYLAKTAAHWDAVRTFVDGLPDAESAEG